MILTGEAGHVVPIFKPNGATVALKNPGFLCASASLRENKVFGFDTLEGGGTIQARCIAPRHKESKNQI
jgi:hypothetical protein